MVLSTVLISSMGLVGCSNSAEDSTVSGLAVDGYLSGSTVTLNSVTTETASNGRWSLSYGGYFSDVVSVRGGTDISTNKSFEGTLKAELGAEGVDVVVTPLSTLVSSLVQSGLLTKAEASATIAKQLGISEATLAGDPIALLNEGTAEQKSDAARAMRSILVVQKAAEAFAKSMGYAGTPNYEATFAAMYDVVAEMLKIETITAVMANTDAITTKLKVKVALTVKNDALLNDRLDAASASVAAIVTAIVTAIPATTFETNIDAVAKAVEQLTTLIENELVNISTATDNTAIVAAVEAASTVATENVITDLVEEFIANPDKEIADTTPDPTDQTTDPLANIDGNILTSFSIAEQNATVSDYGVISKVNLPVLVGTNFTAISAELDASYRFDFTIENSKTLDQYASVVTDKAVTLGIYLKNAAQDSFVLVAVPVLITIDADGVMTFKIEQGGLSKMYSKYAADTQYYATSAANTDAWVKSGQLSEGTESYLNIKLGTIMSHFFDQGALNTQMQETLTKLTTTAAVYEFSVFLGDNGIGFTNDKTINLFNKLDILQSSDIGQSIKDAFSIGGNPLNGYTGTIVLK